MYFDNPFNIPPELLTRDEHEDDISILVGENGSGKSSMLNEIGREFLRRSDTRVIAIANTIHDKFRLRGARYEALKASAGKSIVKQTLKNVLRMLSNQENKRFSEIGRTMDYVRFDPLIGLRVVGVHRQHVGYIQNSSINERDKEEMIFLLGRVEKEARYEQDIFTVNLYQGGFYDQHRANLIEVLRYEKELKRVGAIRDIEVFLSKDGRLIPPKQGSSGELTLITSMMYLMTSIEPHSVILIDEPENSLHPKWQTEYVKLVADLLYRYQPKIIIATHSPLIVNSAEMNTPWVRIFKGSNGMFVNARTDVHNVEEVYQDFFDVTTPENRSLSQNVARKMNELASGEISISEFERTINDFRVNSYDDQQKDVLEGVIEMGRKIIASK